MRFSQTKFTPRRIKLFCQMRLANLLSAFDLANTQSYLEHCLISREFPPYRGSSIDIELIANGCGVDPAVLRKAQSELQSICDAICRALANRPLSARKLKRSMRRSKTSNPRGAPRKSAEPSDNLVSDGPRTDSRKLCSIDDNPEALWTDWSEPSDLASALRLHLERHGETVYRLAKAVTLAGVLLDRPTLAKWVAGTASPRTVNSLEALACIEKRYGLPDGNLRAKLPHPNRAFVANLLDNIPLPERRRLAWHLPTDFAGRPEAEQQEILDWVRKNIISGSTDYRRYQAAAQRQRFAVRFRGPDGSARWAGKRANKRNAAPHGIQHDAARQNKVVDAPQQLQSEMNDLLRFKTATLTAFGMRRTGVWNSETAAQKIEHLGLMFGAFVASPDSEIRGYGAELDTLSFAILMFPQVWDWYLQWREQRRGFYTKWEIDMLAIGLALVRNETGWLRQNPRIAENLQPIPGLISWDDIETVRGNWDAACDAMHAHGRHRTRELKRVARVHRDPFEPILPVLEAKSPVSEYRKITEEIVKRMPDENRYPKAAAEAVRSLLILRLGLHTGLRQKNLRELLLCPHGRLPTAERILEEQRRGEIRWSSRDQGWEVLIPALAFKNANSSFFGSKPFRLILPDLGGLYETIEAWIARHRALLIGPAEDPGTFFVKSAKLTSTDAAYCQNTFFEAWRHTIQRYGIYNPFTGRGAIEGLLPHGPHNVRDVLATHILKQTGSYEQASYAIQDTPEMVAQHYGRFLPQDKAEIAARILNQVWEAA
ncbi:hypothetical protein GTW25_19875 [Aliihoeflea aestuarii]|uniref:hypothetical protein n=1 Tax=Aliihoeflea aestuarii TaxID=453840 RepID=UPI0020941635|nr:hypothetical protein [Aliihoeflea aestuarii]MCO6393282.1 hypothetical protein [Aliihoeflea aestuarii]